MTDPAGTLSRVDALVGSTAPIDPPAAWFLDPQLEGPTALEITEDGRVYGHAALFDSCHTADPQGTGVCVTPPRSRTDYRYFHLGAITTAEGDSISCGTITLGTPHASLRVSLTEAARHYDDTGLAVADVCCGEDSFGIWVAGALRPDVTPERRRQLAAAKLSGDWRNYRGNLELIGLLAVNIPGFLVPRVSARVAAGTPEGYADERLALVAAGIFEEQRTPEEIARARKAMTARARGGISGLAALARRE
jgi:hypothetical protein